MSGSVSGGGVGSVSECGGVFYLIRILSKK